MNVSAPFTDADLFDLDERLFSRADRVVCLAQAAADPWGEGANDRGSIALRHDVDNTFAGCVALAEWEAERGYCSTWFVLHDEPYWNLPEFRTGLERIAELGHEIGLHTNAVTVALLTGRDPHEIVAGALDRLRWWGHEVIGVVAHGDNLCYRAGFVNDETFLECARPDWGAPDRTLRHNGVEVALDPRPLSSFGLEYDANRLSRAMYLSDSGGQWSEPFDTAVDTFELGGGPLHVLQHPCWWTNAFVGVAA